MLGGADRVQQLRPACADSGEVGAQPGAEIVVEAASPPAKGELLGAPGVGAPVSGQLRTLGRGRTIWMSRPRARVITPAAGHSEVITQRPARTVEGMADAPP